MEVEMNKRARANKTAQRIPTEHDLRQQTEPESISVDPSRFETEEKFEEFMSEKTSAGIRLIISEGQMTDARQTWRFNAREIEMNKVMRDLSKTQPETAQNANFDYITPDTDLSMLTIQNKIQNLSQKVLAQGTINPI